MAIRDLIPWRRQETGTDVAPSTAISADHERNPIVQLREQMDRLFDDFFSFPSLSRGLSRSFPTWPSMEVKENDQNVTVTAELPGLSDKDVEVAVDNGVLTIRGEKRSDNEDKDNGWSERFYGRFERRVTLPDGADEDKCEANFSDGVLTVRMPVTDTKRKARKIPILNSSVEG